MTDDSRIVRAFFAKLKPAYFEMIDEEQSRFMAIDRANLDSPGILAISMIDPSGSDDEWDYVGFPF